MSGGFFLCSTILFHQCNNINCSSRRRKITLGSENVGANVDTRGANLDTRGAHVDTRGAHEYVNCTNLFIVNLQR